MNFVGTSDPLFLEESQNKKVTIIPHGVDLPSTLAATTSADLIFLANFSSEPNKIALNHLIFDLDNTLYKYSLCNKNAFLKVFEYISNNFNYFNYI